VLAVWASALFFKGMPNQPQRRARVYSLHHRDYPAGYQEQWFRVVERHDPDVPLPPGHIWLETGGGVRQVPASHFEMVERSKPLILIVDDDPSIRRTLQIALTQAGYDVRQAEDGEEARRLWHQTGPDLILTDIHMPRKSGLLLLEELQAHESPTPVIAMTDGGPTANLNLLGLAKLLGSVLTVAKPFSLDQMVRIVKQELGGYAEGSTTE
jgi:CheY-like chemotaxis protein